MNNLNGKVAVVTGASRGLGRRIAARLAQQGAAVALLAHTKSGLEDTREHLAAMNARTLVVPVDLRQPESVSQVRAIVERDLGVPSILVNAAGVFGPIDLIKDSDPTAWIDTLLTNTVSSYLTCRTFVDGMIAAGWGRIVNITSAASLHQPGPLNSAYATSKVALNQFTRHLASELEGTGVTANVIHPGDVKTDMWADIKAASERLGSIADPFLQWAHWVQETGGDDPEKAADLVAGLMSDEAANVNGQFLWIKDGLQSPIPSWPEPVDQQPWRK